MVSFLVLRLKRKGVTVVMCRPRLLLFIVLLTYRLHHSLGFRSIISRRSDLNWQVVNAIPPEVAQDIYDISAGVAGGSIGVVGTLFALEFKKYEVRRRSQCPYCLGTGHLTCAVCLGDGYVLGQNGARQSCPECEGVGHITCVNCKGDGKLVPAMLDTAISRDPESEFDDIGMT